MRPGPKRWTSAEIVNTPDEEIIRQAEAAMRKLDKALVGRHPRAQGLALTAAVAKWIAGHPEHLRGPVADMFIEDVRANVEQFAEEVWRRAPS